MFKGLPNRALSMRMTPAAWDILDMKCDSLTTESREEGGIDVGRPDVVEGLIRKNGRSLTLADLKRLSKG